MDMNTEGCVIPSQHGTTNTARDIWHELQKPICEVALIEENDLKAMSNHVVLRT